MKTWLFAIAVIALGACGGGDNHHHTNDGDHDDTTTNGDLSISVTPASLTLLPNETQSVTVSIQRSGNAAGAQVSLSMSSPPDGVVAALNNASTTEDSTTIAVSAVEDAQPNTGSITVTASALAVDANAITSASIAVIVGAPPAIAVTGRVVSADLIPLNGVTVDVWSHGSTTAQTVVTNAAGVFTANNVKAPYDVKLSSLGVSGLQALWLGLTRTDPLLSVVRVALGNASGSQVALHFSGGQGFNPQSASTMVAYTIGCPHAGANGSTGLSTDTKTLEGAFSGGDSCTVNALQYHTASGLADALSFGTASVTPVVSGTASQSVTLANLDMHDVAVTAATASGNPLSHVTMLWNNQQRVVQLGDITGANGYDATIKAPADEALGVMMVFNETIGGAATQVNIAKHLSANVSAINVIVPRAPSVVAPASGLVDPTTLAFTITGATGSGYIYYLGSTPGDQLLYIASMDTTLPLSALTAHNILLESGQSYHWQYYTFSNIASADDLASLQATPAGYMQIDGASYSLSIPGSFSTP